MLPRLIANAILFEVGWTACILAGRAGVPLLAIPAIGVLLTLHVCWTTPAERRAAEIRSIVTIAAIGTLVDSANLALGVLTYEGMPRVTPVFVAWIAAFWINFAMLPNASLRWLKARPVLAAILGGILAPPSYLAGAKLGAIGLHENNWLALAVLAAQWAVLMPVAMLIARRFVPVSAPRRPAPDARDLIADPPRAPAQDPAASALAGSGTEGTRAS